MARQWDFDEGVNALRGRIFRKPPKDVLIAVKAWRTAEAHLRQMTDPQERRSPDYRRALDDVRLYKKNAGMIVHDHLRHRGLATIEDTVVDEHGARMDDLETLTDELERKYDSLHTDERD